MLGLSELLIGNAQALVVPPAEGAAGDYAAGMLGVVAMLCVLAAEEADGAAARQNAENREMRALFATAVQDGSAGALRERLDRLTREGDGDLRLSALSDAGNKLRETLIDLHVQADESGNVGLDAAILHLLRRHATARRLTISIKPAA